MKPPCVLHPSEITIFSVKFTQTPDCSSNFVLWDKGRGCEEKLPKLGPSTLQYKEYLSLGKSNAHSAVSVFECPMECFSLSTGISFQCWFLISKTHTPNFVWQIYTVKSFPALDGRNPNTSTQCSCSHALLCRIAAWQHSLHWNSCSLGSDPSSRCHTSTGTHIAVWVLWLDNHS